MVLSGLPKRVKPTHPVPADQNILKRVVERMAHMQRPGDVGGRDHDAKGFSPAGICPGLEASCFFPGFVQAAFGFGRVEGLFHRHDPELTSDFRC